MNVLFRSMAIAGISAVVFLGLGTSKAQAQYLNINVPGFSMSIGGGYPGYYSAYVPGVSVVAPAPVVVGSTYPVYTPYYAPRAYVVPRAYYYGVPHYAYGGGYYRPYRYGYGW
ncbi:MAG: hypothetical protein ACLQIB_16630 [Isosphaeraceae bacterium]